jgi:phenylalanine-4-hydroxylase
MVQNGFDGHCRTLQYPAVPPEVGLIVVFIRRICMATTSHETLTPETPVYVEPPKGELPAQKVVRFEGNEIIHNGPMSDRQNYDQYTEEDHGTWKILYTRQKENLQDIAYSVWLDAMDKVGLDPERLPSFAKLSQTLEPMTGWTVAPVQGFLHARDYFWYLANRLFPAVPRIRPRDQLEFIVEPDLFHDAFGHVPMHSHPVLADFVALYGKVCMEIVDDAQKQLEMLRLYWFTVEYGLIREGGKIKVCGSGHMSGIKESRYSLTDEVEKRPFDMEEVIRQDYNPHILQKKLFVMNSWEELAEAMRKKAKEYGVEV